MSTEKKSLHASLAMILQIYTYIHTVACTHQSDVSLYGYKAVPSRNSNTVRSNANMCPGVGQSFNVNSGSMDGNKQAKWSCNSFVTNWDYFQAATTNYWEMAKCQSMNNSSQCDVGTWARLLSALTDMKRSRFLNRRLWHHRNGDRTDLSYSVFTVKSFSVPATKEGFPNCL